MAKKYREWSFFRTYIDDRGGRSSDRNDRHGNKSCDFETYKACKRFAQKEMRKAKNPAFQPRIYFVLQNNNGGCIETLIGAVTL